MTVMVCERREDGALWPIVTVDLVSGQHATITGAKSAGIAVPVLRQALQVAEAQVTLDSAAVKAAIQLLPQAAKTKEQNDDDNL